MRKNNFDVFFVFFFQELCEFQWRDTAIKGIFFSVCLFFLLTITGRGPGGL